MEAENRLSQKESTQKFQPYTFRKRTLSFREGTVFSPFLSNSKQKNKVAKKNGIHLNKHGDIPYIPGWGSTPKISHPSQGLPETSRSRGSRGGVFRGLGCGGIHRSGAAECSGNPGGFRNVSARWASTTWWLMGTHVSFIFRGHNPYIWGLKPSFFMVLGSKGGWWLVTSYSKLGNFTDWPV